MKSVKGRFIALRGRIYQKVREECEKYDKFKWYEPSPRYPDAYEVTPAFCAGVVSLQEPDLQAAFCARDRDVTRDFLRPGCAYAKAALNDFRKGVLFAKTEKCCDANMRYIHTKLYNALTYEYGEDIPPPSTYPSKWLKPKEPSKDKLLIDNLTVHKGKKVRWRFETNFTPKKLKQLYKIIEYCKQGLNWTYVSECLYFELLLGASLGDCRYPTLEWKNAEIFKAYSKLSEEEFQKLIKVIALKNI